MDSLKEALVRHMAQIKAKMHNQGGGHLPVLNPQEQDKGDHAPELEGSATEEASESPAMEMNEQMANNPQHAPQGPHLMARTGGALSPDEHDKVMQALAAHGAHPGRPAASFHEKVADKSKERFASIQKNKK